MGELLLVVDIGNTNTVLGVFEGERLLCHWRINTLVERTVDEASVLLKELLLLEGINPNRIEGVSLSSVVPPLTPIF